MFAWDVVYQVTGSFQNNCHQFGKLVLRLADSFLFYEDVETVASAAARSWECLADFAATAIEIELNFNIVVSGGKLSQSCINNPPVHFSEL